MASALGGVVSAPGGVLSVREAWPLHFSGPNCAGVRSGCSVTCPFLRKKREHQVFLGPGRPKPLLSEHSRKSGQASSRTCYGLTQLCGVIGQWSWPSGARAPYAPRLHWASLHLPPAQTITTSPGSHPPTPLSGPPFLQSYGHWSARSTTLPEHCPASSSENGLLSVPCSGEHSAADTEGSPRTHHLITGESPASSRSLTALKDLSDATCCPHTRMYVYTHTHKRTHMHPHALQALWGSDRCPQLRPDPAPSPQRTNFHKGPSPHHNLLYNLLGKRIQSNTWLRELTRKTIKMKQIWQWSLNPIGKEMCR